MKNSFFFAICLVGLMLSSCKKDDISGTLTEDNTFIIDGVTYKADNVSYISSSNTLKAQKITSGTPFNNIETMSITFSDDDLPTSGGEFEVVSDPYTPGDATDNDEVALLGTTFPHDFGSYYDNMTYYPVLTPVQHVTVTLKSGKVNVKFSNISVRDQDGNITTMSANITEQ